MAEGAQAGGAGGTGTAAVKASILPSGDQAKANGGYGPAISVSRPDSVRCTRICALPLRSERYAIRVESGDQRGEESRHAPRVNCRRWVPSLPTAHRLEQAASRSWSFQVSTYTTESPPAPIRGSLAVRRAHQSFVEKGWPAATAAQASTRVAAAVRFKPVRFKAVRFKPVGFKPVCFKAETPDGISLAHPLRSPQAPSGHRALGRRIAGFAEDIILKLPQFLGDDQIFHVISPSWGASLAPPLVYLFQHGHAFFQPLFDRAQLSHPQKRISTPFRTTPRTSTMQGRRRMSQTFSTTVADGSSLIAVLKFRMPCPRPLANSGIFFPPNNNTATPRITNNSGIPNDLMYHLTHRSAYSLGR